MKKQIIVLAAAAVTLSTAAMPLSAQTKRRLVPQVAAARQAASAEAASTEAKPQPAVSASTNPTTTAAVATTGPTSQPTRRLDAFLKARFARTPQSVLAALSARPDEKPDEKADDKAEEESNEHAGEAARFARDVIAGRWDAVARTIARFEDPDDARKLYNYVITELASSSGGGGSAPNVPPEIQARMSRGQPAAAAGPGGGGPGAPYLLPQDVIGLIEAAPAEIEEDEQIEKLAHLLSRALATADVVEPVVARLREGIRGIGGADDDDARRRAAKLLMAANRPLEAGEFLPALREPLHENTAELLDLTARYLMAAARRAERPDEHRSRAWEITKALITSPKVEQSVRNTAIARALELWPMISKAHESAWLKQSFSEHPAQGLSVLANVGRSTAQNFSNRDTGKRREGLDQQRKLVDALLAQQKVDAKQWAPVLNVLAAIWVQEAEYTKPRMTPGQLMAQQRIRSYSPYYYEDPSMRQAMNNNEPPALEPQQILDAAPTEAWLTVLDPSLAIRCRAAVAEMHLKNDEPLKAMPILELLAPQHPKLAKELADSLLQAFARLWDTNRGGMNQMPTYYYGPYGYTPMPTGGIPLTRSAQARNLKDLAATLRRLEKLPLDEPLNENALASAFASAHSPAEVFRREDMEAVFGKPQQIRPDVLVSVLQTMRQRLATTWRSPQVQQQQKTKRTDKETEAEATRGYELLTSLVESRLETDPTNWRLLMLQGSALFDWAEFDYGRQVELTIYTRRRDQSFDLFHRAAEQYVAALPEMTESEQTSLVYQQWFNAALGASDLAALTRQAMPSKPEIDRIRAALLAIPGERQADKHMGSFGKWLSDGSQSLKPELKHRFLKAGLEVAQDHPAADGARKLVQYYADLLTEVELFARVEGDPIIGHTNPFGLHFSIRHTQAVGRESGGFNKYLTNQQSGRPGYYYSSGPNGPVNYRDDFEKKIREALVERFDIKAITWFDEKVEARPFGKPGWRETPLAFVLLQPKDASVDQVPPVQIDLDFFDRQSQVILPVSSQVILVDARPENAPPRPVTNIEVTQILDSRDAAAGKLSLDIKATGRGLLGHLDSLLDVSVPGFTIDQIDDQGLAVNSMETEGDLVAPLTERSWLVSLSAAKETLAQAAAGSASFRFPQPRSDEIKVAYKQYSDADVADVDPQIAVTGLPLGSSRRWLWVATAGAVLAIVVAIAVITLVLRQRRRRRPAGQVEGAYSVPEHVTPFTVIDLLKRIELDGGLGLSSPQREQLTREILALQERYFAPHRNGDAPSAAALPDLSAIATQWVGQVQRQR